MATLLWKNNIFTIEDYLVAHGDVKMIGKVINTHVVEFNQAAYDEYHSSRLRSPSPSCTFRRIKLGALV